MCFKTQELGTQHFCRKSVLNPWCTSHLSDKISQTTPSSRILGMSTRQTRTRLRCATPLYRKNRSRSGIRHERAHTPLVLSILLDGCAFRETRPFSTRPMILQRARTVLILSLSSQFVTRSCIHFQISFDRHDVEWQNTAAPSSNRKFYGYRHRSCYTTLT